MVLSDALNINSGAYAERIRYTAARFYFRSAKESGYGGFDGRI